MVIKWSSQRPQKLLKQSSKGPQEVNKRSWKVPQCFKILRSSGLQKVRKTSTKSSRYQENAQSVLRPQDLKWYSKYSKGPQSTRIPQRSSNGTQIVPKSSRICQRPQSPQYVIRFAKVLNILKSPWNSQRPQVLNRSTRSHQTFLKDSSMFWEHQDLRSSKCPQKVHKVLTKSRMCTNVTQGPPRPQVLNWSSKYPQIPQMVLKALGVLKGPQKVFKTTSKSSKRYQCPENPLVVKSSSKSHQMVLTKSSKVPKKSPQKVHKKSSKDPEKFSNVLRSSGPQIFKKSSKAQQSPQKVKEMHKMYPRSSGLRVSSDPQKVLKFLKRSSQPSKSSEVHKRYSRRPQSPQRVINVLKILWSSNFLTGSSNGPNKVFKAFPMKRTQKVHKKSSRGPENLFNVLRASGPQVFKKSSKGPHNPQKVHIILKKSRKCTKGTQGPLRPQVLNWSSKCPYIPQNVLKALEVLRGPQKVSKTTAKSSRSYQRHQNPVIVKSSSKGHQMFLTKSSIVPKNSHQKVHNRSPKDPEKVPQRFEILRTSGLQKVLKRSTKSSRYQENAQNVLRPQVLKWSSKYSKVPQSPRIPERSSNGTQIVPKSSRICQRPQSPQYVIRFAKVLNILKSPWNSQRPQVLNRSKGSHQKFLKGSSMFWEHKVLRSPKRPQKIHKALTKSRKCTNVTQGPLRPQVLNWSSKCPQIPQKILKALEVLRGPQKVFKMASKSSKRSQRPQNPLAVKRSSKGHQMVLTKSSKVSYQKNSNVPQEVIKRSWKVLQCSESIRSSGLQNVLKRSRKCKKGPQRPQASGPHMILKLLKRSLKSLNSS